MKKFSFPLDRVLHWRRLECERERAKLEGLIDERKQIEARIATLEGQRQTTTREFASARCITGAEVATLVHWQAQTRRILEQFTAERARASERIQQQEKAIRDAEGRVKLLERLREKRHDMWKVDLAREDEALAAEAYLGRCIRLRRSTTSVGA
jgi:flagellar export protein FliJ